MKEYVGYILAAVILLFHVFSAEISQRLDWVNFGSEYRANQQEIIRVLTQSAQRLDTLELQVKEIEKIKPSTSAR